MPIPTDFDPSVYTRTLHLSVAATFISWAGGPGWFRAALAEVYFAADDCRANVGPAQDN